MKNQALFSLNDKSKKLKCPLLPFLFRTLRVQTLRSMDMLPYFPPLFNGTISVISSLLPRRVKLFQNASTLKGLLHCSFTFSRNISN